MHRRNSLHRHGFRAVGSSKLERLERREPDGGRSEPGRRARMRQEQRRGERHPPAFVVEVVRMLIMADQHHIDGTEFGGADRRPDRLGQVVVRAGLVESRVDDDPTATEIDDRRRTAQHAERDLTARGVYSAAHPRDCRSARIRGGQSIVNALRRLLLRRLGRRRVRMVAVGRQPDRAPTISIAFSVYTR